MYSAATLGPRSTRAPAVAKIVIFMRFSLVCDYVASGAARSEERVAERNRPWPLQVEAGNRQALARAFTQATAYENPSCGPPGQGPSGVDDGLDVSWHSSTAQSEFQFVQGRFGASSRQARPHEHLNLPSTGNCGFHGTHMIARPWVTKCHTRLVRSIDYFLDDGKD